MSSLGLRNSYSSTITLTVPVPSSLHQRNVSAGSEFPMRSDAYAAREISQRNIDPADAPGSLPSNLPFPQLQQQMGTIKTSQSMQSVASYGSRKGGFFASIGKKSTGKKESSSLGPPSSVAKKDVRGLPISSPSSFGRAESPQSLGAGHSGRPPHQLSISSPMGPRDQRTGSFTPPPPVSNDHRPSGESGRASFDTTVSRMGGPQPKGSFDGGGISGMVTPKNSLPPAPTRKLSSASTLRDSPKGSSSSSPKDGDVQMMSDILPHVNKKVLRVYLSKYGDQMQAIG